MTEQFTAETTGGRLDAFLAVAAPNHTRSFWQKRCTEGMVQVNGMPVKPSYTVHSGDIIRVTLPKAPDFSSQSLPVLYEDDDVIVINKPTGILTHAKGALTDEFSVAEFVRPRTTDGADTNRPGIVHRLDRATSGVIIAAKNPAAKRWLQRQFSLRKAKKTYLALVTGHPKEPAATIDVPIERNPKKPQTFRVGAGGKPATTTYTTVESFAHSTLLSLMPRTGRTHQLRVHLQYIGHPIVGDQVYGKPEPALGRMFLHAAQLEITLPSRERKVFDAPLPADLQHYLQELS